MPRKSYVIDHSNSHLPKNSLLKVPAQARSVEMIHCILDAGMLVIVEQGVDAMSTNRVAEKAGVSNGSLYQYFANREGILSGIIERALLGIMHMLQQGVREQLNEPVDVMMKNCVLLVFKLIEPHAEVVKRIFLEAPLLAEHSVPSVIEATLMEVFHHYLIFNNQRYRLKDGYAGLYVAVNSMIFLHMKWMAQPSPLVTEDEFMNALIRQVCSSLEVIGGEKKVL